MALLPRALVLATKGLLGSVLARATRGRLQIDQDALAVRHVTHAHTTDAIHLSVQGVLLVEDAQHRATSALVKITPPPVVQPVIPAEVATGGGTYYGPNRWFDEPEPATYRYAGFGVLVLQSHSRFVYREAIQPPLLFDWCDVELTLAIDGGATWSHYDQGAIDQDDEDVILLLNSYLLKEDRPYVWPNEKII